MHRDELLHIAERAVGCYLTDAPGIEMAIVVGSVARDLVDAASDVDVVLFRQDVPVLDERARHPLEQIGAQLVARVPTPSGHFDKYVLDGRFVDVETARTSSLEELSAELVDGTCGPRTMKVAAGLRDALPLVGPDLLAAWQARLVFTDALAVTEVTAHGKRLLPVPSLYEMTWARGDALAYAARVSEVLLSATAMLGAANRSFIPVDDPKWLPWHLDRLAHLPRRFAVRADDAMRSPSRAASEDIDALLHEVLDLVDAEVPTASTAVPRYVLSLRRHT